MSTTYSYSTTLAVIDCGECGIPFGMPNNLDRAARDDGRWFWCPNGHKIHYTESSIDRERKEREKAERQLARERARRDQAEADAAAERSRTAAVRAEVTRTRKRLAGGACPCCNRSFVDLARHMAGKHPDYAGMPEVPDDFRWWNKTAAVTYVVAEAREPLTVASVLARLVLAGRRSDTEATTRAALYNAKAAGYVASGGRALFVAADPS